MNRDHLHEAICRTVYGSALQLKLIAADLDMSSSHLSRMLSDHDTLKFPFEKIPALMRVTNDYRILDTLAELSGREVRIKEIDPTALVAMMVKTIDELPDRLHEAMAAVINGNQHK